VASTRVASDGEWRPARSCRESGNVEMVHRLERWGGWRLAIRKSGGRRVCRWRWRITGTIRASKNGEWLEADDSAASMGRGGGRQAWEA